MRDRWSLIAVTAEFGTNLRGQPVTGVSAMGRTAERREPHLSVWLPPFHALACENVCTEHGPVISRTIMVAGITGAADIGDAAAVVTGALGSGRALAVLDGDGHPTRCAHIFASVPLV